MNVTIEQVISARTKWFQIQDMEQEARLEYIKLSDEFMSQMQASPQMNFSPRQVAAMSEFLASFIDDEDEDSDMECNAEPVEPEPEDPNSAFRNGIIHEGQSDESQDHDFQEPAEKSNGGRVSAAEMLQQAGRRQRPLQ